MTLSVPAPWVLLIEARRDELEEALAADLGVPVAIGCNPDRAMVVATVDRTLTGDQLGQLLDSLAPMWPGLLAPLRIGLEVWVDPPKTVQDVTALWRIGLERVTEIDAGTMAVRAAEGLR